MTDQFPGFSARFIKTSEVEIFARIGGAGPPLLLLHGYPQTHLCWHRLAPRLADHFNVVCADLRGYGQSSCPRGDGGRRTYAKRTMAEDMVEVMRELGHEMFAVVGHDRGGRVAYRMALDHPAVVSRLALLDILPTLEVWERITARAAINSYHWSFLAQPYPLPETLIAADPRYYVVHTLESWTKAKNLDCFDPAVLLSYNAALEDPARVHAVCEDYRAGATTDRDLDEADRTAGRKILAPTLALWGNSYVGRGQTDPVPVWTPWCVDVDGVEIDSGHFLAEENPDATLAALLPFLLAG